MSQPDLATKQAIHEALARSAYALDEREMDVLEAGFTEGATLQIKICLLYTSPSPRDRTRSRMPSSA